MSEATTETATEQPEQQPEQGKTFTQEEVDRIVGERLKRERDAVKDLRAKAAEVDQSKSELTRMQEQLAELTKAQAASAAQATRYRVAAANGISNEDADLFLTGGDEDTITAQAKRLIARDAQRRSQGNVVPNEGRTPQNGITDDRREFVRQLTGRA